MFFAYLASIAIGYGWISDTKFQKFSDKDWIWICKNFFGYGSGVKKSISAHLWLVGMTLKVRQRISAKRSLLVNHQSVINECQEARACFIIINQTLNKHLPYSVVWV